MSRIRHGTQGVPTDMADPIGRIGKIRHGLHATEWLKVGGMAATVIGLNMLGWGMLALALRVTTTSRKTEVFGFGTGVLAYTLGMRHAFDADHIAAIDNTTRKLIQDGERPLSVGYFFSLGHSTIVFVLAVLLNFGIRALNGAVRNDDSALHHWTGIIGTSVSGTFLYLIGLLNLVVLVSIIKVSREMRQGRYDDAELERQLDSRGLMNRFLGGYATPHRHAVEDVPRRRAVRSRVRHRHRGRPPGAGRIRRGGWPAVLRRALAAGPLRCRDVPLRHHRRVLHELRLRLGLRQADPQDLLQPDDHGPVGLRRAVHRHRRDPRAHRPGDESERRVLGLHGRTSTSTRAGFIIVGVFVATWIVALAIWHFGDIERKWETQAAQAYTNAGTSGRLDAEKTTEHRCDGFGEAHR